MRAVSIDPPVNCAVFRDFVFHFQADELGEPDRRRLQDHLDDCEACGRYLEVEQSFLVALKSRLARTAAPAALEDRIRSALSAEEPAPPRGLHGWVRGPFVPALAATLLLVALLIPSLGRSGVARAGAPDHYPVVRAVTVVDEDCERAGRSLEEQKGCRDARHLNVLKVADGMYWHVNLDRPLAKELVLDPHQRGRRLVVQADYFPSLETVRLVQVREAL